MDSGGREEINAPGFKELITPESLGVPPQSARQTRTALRDLGHFYMSRGPKTEFMPVSTNDPNPRPREVNPQYLFFATASENRGLVVQDKIEEFAREVGHLKDEIWDILDKGWLSSVAVTIGLNAWKKRAEREGWQRRDLDRFILDVRALKEGRRVDADGDPVPFALTLIAKELKSAVIDNPESLTKASPGRSYVDRQAEATAGRRAADHDDFVKGKLEAGLPYTGDADKEAGAVYRETHRRLSGARGAPQRVPASWRWTPEAIGAINTACNIDGVGRGYLLNASFDLRRDPPTAKKILDVMGIREPINTDGPPHNIISPVYPNYSLTLSFVEAETGKKAVGHISIQRT